MRLCSALFLFSLFLSISLLPFSLLSIVSPFPFISDLLLNMVDPTGKGSESSDDTSPNSASKSPSSELNKKTCADCGTSKTPLWRGGPAGPKSLCNACGIRSRKKKRAILGISKGNGDDVKKGKRSSIMNNKNKVDGESSLNFKQRLWILGRQVLMQRSNHTHHKNKLGEEEQAAVLLMSLSYGSVYA